MMGKNPKTLRGTRNSPPHLLKYGLYGKPKDKMIERAKKGIWNGGIPSSFIQKF